MMELLALEDAEAAAASNAPGKKGKGQGGGGAAGGGGGGGGARGGGGGGKKKKKGKKSKGGRGGRGGGGGGGTRGGGAPSRPVGGGGGAGPCGGGTGARGGGRGEMSWERSQAVAMAEDRRSRKVHDSNGLGGGEVGRSGGPNHCPPHISYSCMQTTVDILVDLGRMDADWCRCAWDCVAQCCRIYARNSRSG
jgi:hypothetical protein